MLRRLDGDHGLTLVELVIAMAIFSLVLVGVFDAMVSMSSNEDSARTNNQAAADAALLDQALGLSVGQGTLVLLDTSGTWASPSSCTSSCTATAVILLDQTDGAGDQVCVEWDLTSSPIELYRLSWPPGANPPAPSGPPYTYLTAGSFSVTEPSGELPAVGYSFQVSGGAPGQAPVGLADTVVAPNRSAGTC